MNASSHRAADFKPEALPAAEFQADEVRAEQAKMLYRQLPLLLAFHVLVVAAMIVGLWKVTEAGALALWSSVMLAVIASRAALAVFYARRSSSRPDRRWRQWFAAGSTAAGACWGLGAAALIPPDSAAHQVFVLLMLLAVGAAAVSVLTAYLPAFYAYLPASLAPVCVVLLLGEEPSEVALGTMTGLLAAALLLFGRTLNKSLMESVRLRFANLELAKQLSEQRDEERTMNIRKSKFLAAASHDLRQPLNALALFTTALDERIKYPEVRRIVDNMNSAIRALEKLFGSLIEISRLDAGVLQPEISSFALRHLVSALANEYTPAANAKGLDLGVDHADVIVRSDPALLERILRNYLSNAIRYTERGTVRIGCIVRGEEVRIDVIDTGIGIPPGQQRAIFEEFRQLGNPDRDREKGLGLGLAIVERVAHLLGHPIEVSSAVGSGSRFSVTVPVGDPAAVAKVARETPSDPRVDLVGLCVLVIDDELAVREGMSVLLGQWGCRVFTAAAAAEAVAALRGAAARPDVIVADYRLGGAHTGVEAIAEIRAELGADVPGLIVTGDTLAERLREARASGHQLLHKPIEPAVLRAFLRSVRRRRAEA